MSTPPRKTNSSTTPDQAELDELMMRRAIRLARKGEGRVEPNPMVGCVVAKGEQVVGEGSHRRFGGDHAEVEALRASGRRARGATVYVSLEPCCHEGKTPPCTEALIKAGVARVVVPMRDPNPLVCGKGLRRLRAAGIEVTCGVGRAEASEVLAPFLIRSRLGRPYVIAKWAQSLDGKLATASGDSQWISGPRARKLVHRIRARVDAIVVGSATAAIDDPLLTARDVALRRRALRVVLDSRCRLSLSSQLVKTAAKYPTMILTSRSGAATPEAARLAQRGVEIVSVRAGADGLNLRDCLRALAQRGATNVLVEGGAKVLGAFFRARLVDEAQIFVAPIMIGQGPEVFGDLDIGKVADVITPVSCTTRRVGDDVFHRLRYTRPPVN